MKLTPLDHEYRTAQKECRRRGTAHATGNSLRAMYAQLICFTYWGKKMEPRFYQHLQKFGTDTEITAEARELMRDHGRTMDIALADKP